MKKKTSIEQIVELFKNNFQMGWMDDYDWENANEESFASIKTKLKDYEEDSFYLFAQSVLRGEYVIRDDYYANLEPLMEQLLSSGEIYDDESNPLKSKATQDFSKMTQRMVEIIRSYRHLLTTLNNKYSERQTKYIINAYKVKYQINSSDTYGALYNILIEVTWIDHFLSYRQKTIDELILYHSELEEIINSKNLSNKVIRVIEILNEKCKFLLKKLLVDDSKEFDYMIDFKSHHFDADGLQLGYLKEMDKRFDFYRKDNYGNEAMGNDMDIRARNETLPIGQYTLLMKFYKDSKNTSNPQIDNILTEFNELYKILSIKFTKRPLDIYALGTLKNYMYNCRFSFLMKASTYTFEQLQKDLNEIVDIQYRTGILNFYPYRKAFEKALQLFHKDETYEKDKLIKYKDFLQNCISKFSEAMQWCRTNCFYPIQNTYRECLVPVADFGAVFIASSFCRPVRYDKLQDELNYFKNQVLLVDNEMALRSEQEDMRNLKKDIDNSRTKEVEILSVFTAIITFLFGTIGFFANNEKNDFLHLVFSVFGLGAILMIFVSGIHLLTMRKEKEAKDYFKHPRMVFCLFTIIASIGLIMWLVAKVESLEVK